MIIFMNGNKKTDKTNRWWLLIVKQQHNNDIRNGLISILKGKKKYIFTNHLQFTFLHC